MQLGIKICLVDTAHSSQIRSFRRVWIKCRQFITECLQCGPHQTLEHCQVLSGITTPPAPNRVELVFCPITSERSIGVANRSDSHSLNAVIIQIVIDKFAELRQSLTGIANQIFEMNLSVIVTQLATVTPTAIHHPLPINSCSHHPRLPVPWQAADIPQLLHGERNVATVPNNMNN